MNKFALVFACVQDGGQVAPAEFASSPFAFVMTVSQVDAI